MTLDPRTSTLTPTLTLTLIPNPCAFHRVLLSRAVRRLTLTPYSHPKPNPCTLHRVLPFRGVRRRILTLTCTLTLTHINRCSLHRVLRLTLTPLPPPFPCSRCCYNANAVLHPSIPPFTPSLAVACFRSPSLAHRRSLSASAPSTSGYHADSTVDFWLPRRFDSPCSTPVLHPSGLGLGVNSPSSAPVRRLPVTTTPIRLSISGYHADSTHRAPCRSNIHPSFAVRYHAFALTHSPFAITLSRSTSWA